MRGTPSSGPVDWDDRNNGASFSLKSHRAWFDLAFNREDFDLGTGAVGFSGDTQSYGLRITPRTDEKTQISLAFARYITDLDNFAADVAVLGCQSDRVLSRERHAGSDWPSPPLQH